MFAKCPAGRPGTADEVANVAELLMSDRGAFITGADFLIDGGVTASYFYGPLKPDQIKSRRKRNQARRLIINIKAGCQDGSLPMIISPSTAIRYWMRAHPLSLKATMWHIVERCTMSRWIQRANLVGKAIR